MDALIAMWQYLLAWASGAGGGGVSGAAGVLGAHTATLDMSQLLALAAAVGWASGLRLYLVVFVCGLAGTLGWIALPPGLHVLQHPAMLAASGFMLCVEFFADKIPGVDAVNNVIQTFVRPAAGAILFAASSNAIADMHPALAMICGLILAGSVHAIKATARPVVTTFSGGLANPLVSTAEDAISAAVSLMAILAPLLGVIVLLGLFVMVLFWYRARREMIQSRTR